MPSKSNGTRVTCAPCAGPRFPFAALLLPAIWAVTGGAVTAWAEPEVPREVEAQVLGHFKGLDQSVLRRMVGILVSLGEGKPESAAKLFQDNSKKALNPNAEFEAEVRRDFAKLSGRLSYMQTIEYIGNTRLSKNLNLALFALNTEYNVHYFCFSLFNQGDSYRFDGYVWRADWEDMLHLKVGLDEKPLVVREFARPGR